MQEACQKIDDMRNVLFINTLINDGNWTSGFRLLNLIN